MKLKDFIEDLNKIKVNHGGNIEVVMADNIPIVELIFSNKYPKGYKVVITDQK